MLSLVAQESSITDVNNTRGLSNYVKRPSRCSLTLLESCTENEQAEPSPVKGATQLVEVPSFKEIATSKFKIRVSYIHKPSIESLPEFCVYYLHLGVLSLYDRRSRNFVKVTECNIHMLGAFNIDQSARIILSEAIFNIRTSDSNQVGTS